MGTDETPDETPDPLCQRCGTLRSGHKGVMNMINDYRSLKCPGAEYVDSTRDAPTFLAVEPDVLTRCAKCKHTVPGHHASCSLHLSALEAAARAELDAAKGASITELRAEVSALRAELQELRRDIRRGKIGAGWGQE